MTGLDIPSFLWGFVAAVLLFAFIVTLAALFQNPTALAVKSGK